jgi:site-specific DNA recombinase
MKQEQEIRVLPSSTYENNIDETTAGQLAANIYGAFNQYLSDSYSEKQRDRSRLAVAAGRVPWRAPIGYLNIKSKTGPNIKPDGERAPLIARAFELMATGLHKKTDVLKFVTSEGLTTMTGKPVTPRSFDNILRNPIYAGWIPLSQCGECPLARGLHQPIITQDLFDRVQAVRAGKEPSRSEREAES